LIVGILCFFCEILDFKATANSKSSELLYLLNYQRSPEPYLISYLVLSTLKAVVAVFPFTVISNATGCVLFLIVKSAVIAYMFYPSCYSFEKVEVNFSNQRNLLSDRLVFLESHLKGQ
jgi:hypothetical protein